MGDRRKGDRRAPEEGVIKINAKKLWIYIVLMVFLIGAIALNVVVWAAYIKQRKQYDTIIDHYYNDDTNSSSNISNTASEEVSNGYTCDLSINGDKTSVKAGETLEYELSILNINANAGIKAFETYIEYDPNVFDCKVKSNEEDNWNKIGFLENFLTMYKNENANTDEQTIVKIELTAKKSAPVGTYKLAFKNIRLTAEDEQSFKLEDSSIDIKVD